MDTQHGSQVTTTNSTTKGLSTLQALGNNTRADAGRQGVDESEGGLVNNLGTMLSKTLENKQGRASSLASSDVARQRREGIDEMHTDSKEQNISVAT